MKIKNHPVEIKAGPDDGLAEGQFTAYASVFGNEDSYGDVVMPGAFKDTLAEWAASGNPIPLLFGHNMSDPDYNIGAVASAAEDDHGLLITGQLDLESPKALQTYRLLKGKRINQMSFAYDVLDGGSVTETINGTDAMHYELRKLKLYEVSVVSLGANQETEILAVKAAVEALDAGIKSGAEWSAKNEASVRDAHAAAMTTTSKLKDVLDAIDASKAKDQGKASASGPAKDEEPSGAKSEEPSLDASVDDLAATIIRIKILEGVTQ